MVKLNGLVKVLWQRWADRFGILPANSVVLLKRHSFLLISQCFSVFLEGLCMEIKYSFQVHSFLPLGTTRCQNLPGHIIIPTTAGSVLQRITQQEQMNR